MGGTYVRTQQPACGGFGAMFGQLIPSAREYYRRRLDGSLFLTRSVRFHILLLSFIDISTRRSEIEADGY